MKDSRVSIHHNIHMKHANPQPKSNISSLKAIINQGRVPLAQYINHRPKLAPSHQHLSYFDKLKAMFHHQGELLDIREANCSQFEHPPQPMEIQQQTNKLQNYLYNYEENGLGVQHEKLEECMKTKQRSKSVNAKVKYNQISKTKIQPSRPSHMKNPSHTQTAIQNSSKIQAEAASKIPLSSYNLFRSSKPVKKETINYKKFNVMYQSEQWEGGLVDLEQLLGSGTSASVRIGKDKKNGKQFAVKIYEKYKLVQAMKKKRVLQQIQLLAKLKHPNIVAMSNCFEDKRQIHLILQLVPQAQTLQDFIRRNTYEVPDSIKKQVGVKIIQAVQYMHEMGVAHRDLKTENIILGTNGVVKLIDFGFATCASRTDTHCGTPNYMAPELFQKKSVYSPIKVDIWALGVLLYYLHQGCYPFRGYNEKELIRSIFQRNLTFKKCNQKVKKVIESALQLSEKERASASTLLKFLKI